ncbi:metal ABC transporter substrate-binding protein [Bhargavaea ullalensis]|uniref:ABC-type Zn uptake system ZnuABC Zn-binding protein ZnuA n=1 Tax=Bhargavaea ullalensis TaxID=1265685 RepID=A0ABV2GE88_9BACL
MKKKLWGALVLLLVAAFTLGACGSKDGKDTSGKTAEDAGKDKLHVVATFSILYDIANEVGGDRVSVHSMVPIGTAPHEYEPLPEDVKKTSDADVIFYNGLNLEGGEEGWFSRLLDTTGTDESKVFELMEGVEPLYLSDKEGHEGEVNPHAFLDPTVGIQMVENARDAFVKVDPDHKDEYEKNAENMLNKLREIDQEYKDKIAEIPETKRILVTSERAYQYLAKTYGLEEGYIWAIDTEENGSPAQIKSLVDFVREHDVPALFVESNVDRRPMETVSNETGVPIAHELYSDELGKPGSEGETYTNFLKYNIENIHDGLMK